MVQIRRFENLICWQKARQLTNAIYDLTNVASFARDYKLRDQIRDAAGSAMHNIAEGSDAGTDTEFIRFLKIARRSCSEVQSELYLAVDREYILDADAEWAHDLADEVKRLINGLIAYLRRDDNAKEPSRQVRELPEPYLTSDYSTTD